MALHGALIRLTWNRYNVFVIFEERECCALLLYNVEALILFLYARKPPRVQCTHFSFFASFSFCTSSNDIHLGYQVEVFREMIFSFVTD